MGKMIEPEADEGVEDSGDQSGRCRSRERAPEDESAVTAEGEAEQDGDVVDRQRRKSEQIKRQDEDGDAEEIFVVRQRVFARIEDVGVVDMRRRIRDAVEVPIENPGVEQRLAEVGDSGVEAEGDR